jgi:RNA polymerase sigma-70 factor (ECF subfamily)
MESHQEEADWIHRAKRGDSEAFGLLVRAYHPRLAGLLNRLLRNPAMVDEIEQQVWIKTWRNLPRFAGRSSFFSWLYTIATRTVADAHRSAARRGEVVYLEERSHVHEGPDGRPDRDLMNRETGERIQAALDRCSAKHREVLVLREMEGLSYEEIAEVMKCRVGTVMSRLHHARSHMRTLLEKMP